MSDVDIKKANTLNKYDINKSVKAKIKKSVPKPVLCTPYKVEWPQVEQNVQEKVIAFLKTFFKTNNLSFEPLSKDSLKNLKKAEKKAKLKEHAIKNKSSETAKLRSQLAFGIQEVTRNVENKNLSLIIVDRSSPWQLHRHLIQLSTLRECPAMAINQLSETLSPLLSLSKLCVFGVKNFNSGDSDIFKPLVDFIAPLCPKYDIPWLDAENQLMEIKKEHVEGSSKCLAVDEEKSNDVDDTEEENDNKMDDDDDDEQERGDDNDDSNKDTEDKKDETAMECDNGDDDDDNGDDDDDNGNDDNGDDDDDDDEDQADDSEPPPYTDLYISSSDVCESRLTCEIVDIDDDDLWNYNIESFKEKVAKKEDSNKIMIFNNPTNRTAVKRFHGAEVRKIQKNQFKKRKLN